MRIRRSRHDTEFLTFVPTRLGVRGEVAMKWLSVSAALLFCCSTVNSANAFFHHGGCGCGCAPSCCAPAPSCCAPAPSCGCGCAMPTCGCGCHHHHWHHHRSCGCGCQSSCDCGGHHFHMFG